MQIEKANFIHIDIKYQFLLLYGQMKIALETIEEFQKLAPMHRGVFTTQDLANLFLTQDTIQLKRRLKPLIDAKMLFRFCRGFYVTKEFNLEWLSQRIFPNSAISFGNVLSKEMLIGSIPQKTVYAVKIGKTRIYKSPLGQVVHFGFSSREASSLWFGYDVFKDGIRYADKEKAFLDTLYFYQSGNKFSFDVYSDINLKLLNQKKLSKYLSAYKNPKFRKFAEGVIHGSNSIR